jgi:LMBR1 domain-containing protein 1
MANYNPLWPVFLLLMGILAAVLTTTWVLHVVVFMFFYPPQSQFLNKYFIQVRPFPCPHSLSLFPFTTQPTPHPKPLTTHTHTRTHTHTHTQFDEWFPLFGVLSVAIFSLYLLFCVVAGNFKLGMRLLCIELHPMKVPRYFLCWCLGRLG